MSSEAGEEGIISTNPQHSKWISDKQGCSLSQRSSLSIFPRTKLPFPSRWFYPDCTESLLHACHCRLYPSDAECRGSMGTVGLWWPWERPHVGAVQQSHIQGSPQEWVPRTRSWSWECPSHQLLWCSGWMQCWKHLTAKHSHGKAKLEYYTNLNTQKFVFGLLWNSMRTQILGILT